MLTFDGSTHTYFWDGARVPGLTDTIKPLIDLSMVDPDTLELARQKGTAIHKMAELDLADDLDVDGLPEWMAPLYRGWRKFREDTGLVHWASECKLYHPSGWACTPDIIGLLTKAPGRKAKGGAVIEIKRTFIGGPAIGVQTAAQLEAWNRNNPDRKASQRYGLRLLPGDYRLEPWEDPDDYAVFLACLTIKRYKEKHA